jgi:hypothetical protein
VLVAPVLLLLLLLLLPVVCLPESTLVANPAKQGDGRQQAHPVCPRRPFPTVIIRVRVRASCVCVCHTLAEASLTCNLYV